MSDKGKGPAKNEKNKQYANSLIEKYKGYLNNTIENNSVTYDDWNKEENQIIGQIDNSNISPQHKQLTKIFLTLHRIVSEFKKELYQLVYNGNNPEGIKTIILRNEKLDYLKSSLEELYKLPPQVIDEMVQEARVEMGNAIDAYRHKYSHLLTEEGKKAIREKDAEEARKRAASVNPVLHEAVTKRRVGVSAYESEEEDEELTPEDYEKLSSRLRAASVTAAKNVRSRSKSTVSRASRASGTSRASSARSRLTAKSTKSTKSTKSIKSYKPTGKTPDERFEDLMEHILVAYVVNRKGQLALDMPLRGRLIAKVLNFTNDPNNVVPGEEWNDDDLINELTADFDCVDKYPNDPAKLNQCIQEAAIAAAKGQSGGTTRRRKKRKSSSRRKKSKSKSKRTRSRRSKSKRRSRK